MWAPPILSCAIFFFFQAEDGIRDLIVTGVQTCALPIYDDALPHQLLAEQAVELVSTVGQGRTGADRGGLGLAGGYGRMLTLSAPVRLGPSPSAQHLLDLPADALEEGEHLDQQVLGWRRGRRLVREAAPDHRVHLAALPDQAVELGRHPGRGLRVGARFVQHVDRLVGARALRDEAVRQYDRRLEEIGRAS